MINAVRYQVPRRKALLFAAAAVRQFGKAGQPRSVASRCKKLADAVEAYAERRGKYADVEEAREALTWLRQQHPEAVRRLHGTVQGAEYFPMQDDPAESDTWPDAPELCEVLREVVGNPRRPVKVEPRWLAWNNGTVATLARTVRTEKKFDLLPLLADALEDAGCSDAELLAHLRSPGPHVAGCWAVDLLTPDEYPPRRSLEETWKLLKKRGFDMPLTRDKKPFVPPKMPAYDDDELGFSFFRTGLDDYDLGGLTLPRTYFGRSGLERVSFRNTDLSQSRMCWNDFIDCDFSGADLSRSDMRSATFDRCLFVGADLSRADLRGSAFEGCDLTGANVKGAKADEDFGYEYELQARLSPKQRKSMKWYEDPGEEPDGG